MIFVDTSAWIALVDRGDKFHKRANEWWVEQRRVVQLITSNIVVMETLGWVRYNRGRKIAIELGKSLYLSREVEIKRLTPSIETQAWELFSALEGRGISMVDCTSFVIMKESKIDQVFGFDQDFSDLGFQVVPGAVE